MKKVVMFALLILSVGLTFAANKVVKDDKQKKDDGGDTYEAMSGYVQSSGNFSKRCVQAVSASRINNPKPTPTPTPNTAGGKQPKEDPALK